MDFGMSGERADFFWSRGNVRTLRTLNTLYSTLKPSETVLVAKLTRLTLDSLQWKWNTRIFLAEGSSGARHAHGGLLSHIGSHIGSRIPNGLELKLIIFTSHRYS